MTSLSKWDSPNTHKHYSKLKPPPPLHLCLLSLSKKRLIFSLFLIRAILLVISLLLSMWTTLQYPEYRRKSVPTFKSTKEAAHLSFHQLPYVMPTALSLLARLIQLWMWPEFFKTLRTSTAQLKPYVVGSKNLVLELHQRRSAPYFPVTTRRQGWTLL